MNLDGCRNCKYMEYTGMAQIMRCRKDGSMVEPLDTCSNYENKLNVVDAISETEKKDE